MDVNIRSQTSNVKREKKTSMYIFNFFHNIGQYWSSITYMHMMQYMET